MSSMDTNTYYNTRQVYKIGGARLRHICSILPENTSPVLDVGCGSGELARELKQLGYVVDGLDVSASALNSAQPFLRHSYLQDISQSHWEGDIEQQQYGVVIASEVLEHTFSPDVVLSKIGTLLGKNGYVILTVPNFLFWKIRLRVLLGDFRYEADGLLDFGHIRFFTHEYAMEVIKKAGFMISKSCHVYPNLDSRNISWLGRLLPGVFAYQFVFLLQKQEDVHAQP